MSIDPRAALPLGTGTLISAFLVKQHTYRTGNLPKLQFAVVAQQEQTVGLATPLSASKVPAPGSSSEEDWGSGGLSGNGYGHLEGAESRVPRSRPTAGDLSAATTPSVAHHQAGAPPNTLFLLCPTLHSLKCFPFKSKDASQVCF